jgi:hypothetical protein
MADSAANSITPATVVNSSQAPATAVSLTSPSPSPSRPRQDFLGKHADLKTQDGHQRVVRHGHLPDAR